MTRLCSVKLYIRLCVATVLILSLSGCTHPKVSGGGGGKSTAGTPFHVDLLLRTTPVKNQGRSSLCWLYAMLATIETDRLMLGDSVNLSPNYLERRLLEDQTDVYCLSGGRKHLHTRGVAPMALSLIYKHGLVPFDSYYTRGSDVAISSNGIDGQLPATNHKVMLRKMEQAMSAEMKRGGGLARSREAAATVLDTTLGYLPLHVFMLGMEYTFMEFGHSCVLPGDYVALTSFTHHPFGEEFALEVPDNSEGCMFQNVPIDSLMDIITRQLRLGYAVCWEGDTSNGGYSFDRGIADTRLRHASQADRQRAFETLRSTDDHAMTLVGLAHDDGGRRYFIAKNTWGDNNPYGGFMYVSEDYVRLYTTLIVTHKSSTCSTSMLR